MFEAETLDPSPIASGLDRMLAGQASTFASRRKEWDDLECRSIELERERIAALPKVTYTRRRIKPTITAGFGSYQQLLSPTDTLDRIKALIATSEMVDSDATIAGIAAILCHSDALSEEVA